MEKKWITTEQMLENLKNDANHEHEYNLWLCNGFLTSTHWVVYVMTGIRKLNFLKPMLVVIG